MHAICRNDYFGSFYAIQGRAFSFSVIGQFYEMPSYIRIVLSYSTTITHSTRTLGIKSYTYLLKSFQVIHMPIGIELY